MKVVHLFNHEVDSRSLLMVAQGLMQHPDIFKVSFNQPVVSFGKVIAEASDNIQKDMHEADLIFRPNDAHFNLPEIDRQLNGLLSKVIYYDIKDDTAIDQHRLGHCKLYLKRSWKKYHTGTMPFPYAILDEYTRGEDQDRDIDVVYLFNPKDTLNEHKRYVVYEELQRAGFENSIIGTVTHGRQNGRRMIFDKPAANPFIKYLDILKRAKIVVTCGPDHPGGDSRLWEALASGALVVTDRPDNVLEDKLEDMKHCLVYDGSDRTSIQKAIARMKILLEYDNHREPMAYRGHIFAMAHHRAENRIDRVLNEL